MGQKRKLSVTDLGGPWEGSLEVEQLVGVQAPSALRTKAARVEAPVPSLLDSFATRLRVFGEPLKTARQAAALYAESAQLWPEPRAVAAAALALGCARAGCPLDTEALLCSTLVAEELLKSYTSKLDALLLATFPCLLPMGEACARASRRVRWTEPLVQECVFSKWDPPVRVGASSATVDADKSDELEAWLSCSGSEDSFGSYSGSDDEAALSKLDYLEALIASSQLPAAAGRPRAVSDEDEEAQFEADLALSLNPGF